MTSNDSSSVFDLPASPVADSSPGEPVTPVIDVGGYPQLHEVFPLVRVPDITVAVPGSKSITNRALILAALADGPSRLTGALEADDTAVMMESLRRLGISADWEGTEAPGGATEGGASGIGSSSIRVSGLGGRIPASSADLFLGNSGTSIRFLTALCALGHGSYRLDGVQRMRQRPQADLLTALSALGAEAVSELDNGCPPLEVRGERGLVGGKAKLRAEASSQFLTALLMVAPYAQTPVEIEIEGELRPLYVEITTRMMAQWGVTVEAVGTSRFTVMSGGKYLAQASYEIEPDASSASYFFAAAAVTGGRVTVPNLTRNALQGDVRFATDVLVEMGCRLEEGPDGLTVIGPEGGRLHGVDRDMSLISDTSLTLAAIAPFADSPTRVRNIAHSRLQECDRVAAVCTELKRLGVQLEEYADGYTIYPAKDIQPATIHTYHDHRVAMSFALVGLKVPGIVIADPGCVAKTFPTYWETLDQLR